MYEIGKCRLMLLGSSEPRADCKILLVVMLIAAEHDYIVLS